MQFPKRSIGVTCGVARASIKTNITPDYVKLSVFNVGQGNCVLLKKGGNAVMIDAGTLKSPKCIKLLERELAAELKNTVIRAVVVTHRDVDHWGLFLDAKEGTMFYCVTVLLILSTFPLETTLSKGIISFRLLDKYIVTPNAAVFDSSLLQWECNSTTLKACCL